MQRALFDSVRNEVLRAFTADPPAFSNDRIDRAFNNHISKAITQLAKSRSGSISLSGSTGLGDAVESFVKASVGKWVDRLRSASPSASSDFEREFARLLAQKEARPGEGRIFFRTNAAMITVLKDLAWIESDGARDRVQYLAPVLRLASQQKRLLLASLNYDNCVELLCAAHGVPFRTGIEEWSESGTFGFDQHSDGIFVLKMHGSIDWLWESGEPTDQRAMPQSVIRKASNDEIKRPSFRPAVIFGHRNKLTAEGPFLDLLRAFKEELDSTSMLTVVGYSFRDPHVNVFISQWLNQNADHVLRIVNGPAFFEKCAGSYATDLSLLRAKRPSQVQFIPKYAREGLEELYGV